MKIQVLFTVITLVLPQLSLAGTPDFKPSKTACAGIDKQIDRVNSKLRAGYSIREGERLKEDLRMLKSKRYSCTRMGFSVE